MPSRNKNRKKSNRKKQVKSPRRKIIKRSLRFTPKFVIEERVDKIEDNLDTVFQSNTGRIPRDVANIIAKYDDFDDGGKRSYWRNHISDDDEYKKTRRTGRENNRHMIYKVIPLGNALFHHEEWHENGQQKTDCYYYDNLGIKDFHGNCKQWNSKGKKIYDRTFDRGDETLMSKIFGEGGEGGKGGERVKRPDLEKVYDERTDDYY